MNTTSRTAAQEWQDGWTVVFASFVGFFFFSGMFASMSVFVGPLAEEFGWSRTLISAGLLISSITTALLSPVLGIPIDKFGTRKLAVPGVVLTAGAISLFALSNGSALLWLGMWGFYAVISLSTKTTIWTAAIAGTFDKSRGLALAITLAGATAAHGVMPIAANYLIQEFGWRMAYVVVGFGLGAITLVIVYLFFFDAHDNHRKAQAKEGAVKADMPNFPGLTLAQAWRDSALWRIAISILVIMAITIGLLFHQVEILIEVGVTRTNAAWLAGLAGFSGIIGKVVTGLLLDRYRGNWVGGITMTSAAVAFAILLMGAQTLPLLLFAMLVNGYTAGAKLHIVSYLTVRYCGMKNFGKIYGVITSMVALGSGTGAIIAGRIYDVTGSYDMFLLIGTIGLVFSGLMFFTLPRYPDWQKAAEPELKPA